MKCKKCNREGAYVRFQRQEIVCRYCGEISKLQGKKEKKQDENINPAA